MRLNLFKGKNAKDLRSSISGRVKVSERLVKGSKKRMPLIAAAVGVALAVTGFTYVITKPGGIVIPRPIAKWILGEKRIDRPEGKTLNETRIRVPSREELQNLETLKGFLQLIRKSELKSRVDNYFKQVSKKLQAIISERESLFESFQEAEKLSEPERGRRLSELRQKHFENEKEAYILSLLQAILTNEAVDELLLREEISSGSIAHDLETGGTIGVSLVREEFRERVAEAIIQVLEGEE